MFFYLAYGRLGGKRGHCSGGVPSPPGGSFWLGGTRRFAVGCLYLVLPVPPHFFGACPKKRGGAPKKGAWGGGAPVRFRDPPASPTRVGAATRPLRCPLRGRIESLAPRARGWVRCRLAFKSFLPRFFTKKRAGSRGGALGRAPQRAELSYANEAQEGVKGEPSPGVPPLRAAPAARSPCDLRTPAVIRRRTGMEPRPYRGLVERGGVCGGRMEGSSRTPTPTACGKRAACRGIIGCGSQRGK